MKENKNGIIEGLVSLLGATLMSPEEETTSLLSGLSVVVKSTIRKLPKFQSSSNECGHQDEDDDEEEKEEEEEEDFFLLNLRASSPLIVDNDDEINSKDSKRERIAVGCVIGNRE